MRAGARAANPGIHRTTATKTSYVAMRRIAIVSIELDLHAHAVAKRLREHFDCDVYVIVTDIAHQSVGFLESYPQNHCLIESYDGRYVQIDALDVVWWRRANQPQQSSDLLIDERIRDFVSREWRFALQNSFFCNFNGIWVNHPWADIRASSKLLQLRAANAAGLQIPDTIITNRFCDVINFWNRHNANIIAKKISGAPGFSLATIPVTEDMLSEDDIKLAPAIYQPKIDAYKHLRVLVLGNDVYAAGIKTKEMDWRRDLNGSFENCELSFDLKRQIINVIDRLGLRMGVMDFIEAKDNTLYFLEVNPQGQFLFIEGLTGEKWALACAKFLASIQN